MQFCEKLDFLMRITQTTNSALSQNIKLDASHISRLRRGKRNALKDETCLRLITDYFVKRCTADYQRKALTDALDIVQLPNDDDRIADLVMHWLSNEKKNETQTVATFLARLSEKQKASALQNTENYPCFPQADLSIYYGVEGKRQAVVYFLSEVLAQNKPQTLLLFSDESTEWMTGDREFAAKWALLMTQVLAKGNRIKIIHTVSRHLDEMLNAISQWMPLYMSGAIEPYYYPKKKDGIFKHTLFISPDISAVVSDSVGNMHHQAANLLLRNTEAISAFEEEFKQYLALCKPLMRIFTTKDEASYFDTLLEFEKEKNDSLMKTESLSLLTMPESLFSQIMTRLGRQSDVLNKYQKMRTRLFENSLQTNFFTEIIRLFDPETVKNKKVKVSFSDMLNEGITYYTAEEYVGHLENIIRLLKTYDHFHAHIVHTVEENRYTVYAKEDTGAIVAKTSTPPIVLAINEHNMTAAFWDFLKDIIEEKTFHLNNKETVDKLEAYVRKLKRV